MNKQYGRVPDKVNLKHHQMQLGSLVNQVSDEAPTRKSPA